MNPEEADNEVAAVDEVSPEQSRPADVNLPDENSMDFGYALDQLRVGKAVYRTGWNAGGQYIYLIPAAEYPAQTEVAKDEFGDKVPYGPYLAIKTVQHNVVPWLASQTDLLAEDWHVVVNTSKESKK